MPPSFGGTSRCSRTRKPARLEPGARRGREPPVLERAAREHDRVGRPCTRHSATADAATVSWKAAAISSRGRPARARRRLGRRAPWRRRSATARAPPACRRRAARARSPPDPRSVTRSRTPSTAATASNSRPIPEESGALTARLSRTRCQCRPRHGQAGALEVDGGDPPGLADGGLAAGERHGLEPGEPLEAVEVGSAAARRPRASRRCRTRCRRRRARARGPSRRARRGRRPRARGGAAPRRAGSRCSERPLRRQVLGVEVAGDRLGLDARASRGRARGRSRNAR